ncbi:ATP-grasp domain-containing protein, partial [Pseudomonas aeruginosa]|nr:ATP-grasp domain-containing protein [Pseudomonas aeruginosa]
MNIMHPVLRRIDLNLLPVFDAVYRSRSVRLAAEELQLPTSRYRFADSEEGFRAAVTEIDLPCIVKPVMSSSGKGQSFIRSADQLSEAWRYAQQGGRAGAGRVIVEGVVNFDFEITLLTVSAVDGVHFCAPVGHRQED